jgi:hypothetical protein
MGPDLPSDKRPDRVERPTADEQETDPLGFNPYGSGPVPIRMRSEATASESAGHADAPGARRLPPRILEAAFLFFYP